MRIGPVAGGCNRLVVPCAAEPLGMLAAQVQRLPCDPQFRQPLVAPRQDLFGRQAGDFGEQLAPQVEIDRPAIVGIHQAQVPQLVALIDVGHAGRSSA